MRDIQYLVVHCSATKANLDFDAADIDAWHKQRGWSGIGYHYVIKLDGTIETGRPIHTIGAHVYGYNRNSIGICYIGGLDLQGKSKDTRTPAQKGALENLLMALKTDYPQAEIKGHRDFSPDLNGDGIIQSFEFLKDCPCFDAIKAYKNLCI